MARKFYIFPHTDNVNMVAVEDCATPIMIITNKINEPFINVPVPPDFPKIITECIKKGEMPVVTM